MKVTPIIMNSVIRCNKENMNNKLINEQVQFSGLNKPIKARRLGVLLAGCMSLVTGCSNAGDAGIRTLFHLQAQDAIPTMLKYKAMPEGYTHLNELYLSPEKFNGTISIESYKKLLDEEMSKKLGMVNGCDTVDLKTISYRDIASSRDILGYRHPVRVKVEVTKTYGDITPVVKGIVIDGIHLKDPKDPKLIFIDVDIYGKLLKKTKPQIVLPDD